MFLELPRTPTRRRSAHLREGGAGDMVVPLYFSFMKAECRFGDVG
jgi:hypothetical protein